MADNSHPLDVSGLSAVRASLAHRYRVERELGRGGMAVVLLARDLKHDRKVAIKVLRPDLAPVIGADRFLREIKTIATLQHPHILGLIDSGEVDATAYYVMPFVEGGSLRDRLLRERQLPIGDTVRLMTEVAAALDYAHRHGVIHRDIKPENILLHDGAALVADFGIALAAPEAGLSRLTETGMSVGTPQYMSPEQAMGEREITTRSDVFALGAVTYEMLMGTPPFSGPNARAVIARMMTEPPPPLRPARPTVPEGMEHAVLTALQAIPADRFGSTVEFSTALANAATVSGTAAAVSPPPRAGGFQLTEMVCRRLSRAGFDPRLVGTTLEYLDNGRTSPVLVCFIPAWGRGVEQNSEIMSRLSHRVVIPTLRGFEASTPWRPSLTIEDHIVLLREFLHDMTERLKPRLVVLAGFSTGSDIALRFAATPDPEGRLPLDGCVVLGPNLAEQTCFFTSTMASLLGNDDAALLAALQEISAGAVSLEEWANICEYAVRIVGTFRHAAAPVRAFASGIADPFRGETLVPFANWYREARAAGCRLRCVFEDSPMYRDLVRELHLRNLDDGLLGEHYEEGSLVAEAGTSHFDLVDPSRVADHLESLIASLSPGA